MIVELTKEMLEVMKLVGNLTAGLGGERGGHLNFSRDALMSTLFEMKRSYQFNDESSRAELECRDVILLAEELIKTTDTGSEAKKKEILSRFVSRYGLQPEEIDDIGKILLVGLNNQGEVRIGLSLDSFEKIILQWHQSGLLKDKHLPQFERYLFNRFLRVSGRQLTADSPPIQVMLARPLIEVEQVAKHLKSFDDQLIVERKYDGERMLVK